MQRSHYRTAAIFATYTITWWLMGRRLENSAAAGIFSRLAPATVLVVPLGVMTFAWAEASFSHFKSLCMIIVPGLAGLSWIVAWDAEHRFESPIRVSEFVLLQTAFLLFVAGLAVFESAVFVRRSRFLLTLATAACLLWAPFMLDAIAVRDEWSLRRLTISKFALGHSPIALTGACVDRFDLYKQAHVYARYRIAEELVPPPSPRTGSIRLGIAGVLLGLTGLRLSHRRRSDVGRCADDVSS